MPTPIRPGDGDQDMSHDGKLRSVLLPVVLDHADPEQTVGGDEEQGRDVSRPGRQFARFVDRAEDQRHREHHGDHRRPRPDPGAPRELTWSNQGGSIRSRPIEKIIRPAALTVTMLRAMKLVITAMIESVPRNGARERPRQGVEGGAVGLQGFEPVGR